MNGAVLRTNDAAPRPWQLRPWPNDPAVSHLVFVDHLDVPTAGEVRAAVEAARRQGATAVRTSALFPRAARVMYAAGFEPIDRLTLLHLPLRPPLLAPHPSGDPPAGHGAHVSPREHRVVPLRPWQHRVAAAVDQEAFGPLWGNDAGGIAGIRHATPVHRARAVRRHRELAGFVIAGAAGDTGYLQRLAVGLRHRRQGIARTLCLDAIDWMRGRRLTSVLVNTGITNRAALALYDDLGFSPTEEELVIAELTLGGHPAGRRD